MNSIKTSLCAAAKIAVKPVQFQLATHDDRPYWFATQTLEITLHDGNECSVVIHLEEGCCALLAGEPVVMPTVPESAGAPA
ncbi:hypothetical protein [Cupriavidus sp. amp6]|uniref:hypothetical protein n=1 Tax=Cupriavidus sp. amp6 TaxID=388051 RepID=UPI000407F26E|nr:hypothetical protein [Cupriavidus sp. amp6]